MIHNIDCLQFLRKAGKYRTIFADVPDNIGLNYIDFRDHRDDYHEFIRDVIVESLERCDIFWLSYNQKHDQLFKNLIPGHARYRQIIWRYTFGQYNDSDFASGYRPILLFTRHGTKLNYEAIRIESTRMKIGDRRAAGPRIPDDVWEYPRVVGNAKERRSWHPTQHPEALMERILLLSNTVRDKPVGEVLDLFLGSGTTAIVARRLGIQWTGCEISPFYCKMLEGILHET